jgi:hypothetical protein
MPCVENENCQSDNCDKETGLCKPVDYNQQQIGNDSEEASEDEPSELEYSEDEDSEDISIKKRNPDHDDSSEISSKRIKPFL